MKKDNFCNCKKPKKHLKCINKCGKCNGFLPIMLDECHPFLIAC